MRPGKPPATSKPQVRQQPPAQSNHTRLIALSETGRTVSPPPPPGPGFPGAAQPQWQPGPQQPCPPGPPPAPTNRGRARKWILGGVALLAVIAVTAAITVVISRGRGDGGDDGGDGAPTPPADTYGLASADDTTAATIITEEPTCTQWRSIVEKLVQDLYNGWNQRDKTGSRDRSRDQWTPEERAQYDQVAQAHRRAADEAVALAKQTPPSPDRRCASARCCRRCRVPDRRRTGWRSAAPGASFDPPPVRHSRFRAATGEAGAGTPAPAGRPCWGSAVAAPRGWFRSAARRSAA
ncbi:hypothetical protein C731_4228 [Mycolicibacterium hassiacum DSM 44199]|uniref:Uncharacterized protein n=1 Tax=Mycolicibacterium hassiacum (strain DSM 44199 / CIP 105218 / JCM 12690 / 3849) TaxID=1122247 RepID=K5BIP9_MYCHD|nr:hypothetical protein C731_4228 [Mycolicibacterium hassiacum DSM 44199]